MEEITIDTEIKIHYYEGELNGYCKTCGLPELLHEF